MTRKSTTYNKVIGIKDDEIYLLNDIFKYKDGLKGATGSVLSPLTQEQVEGRCEPENFKEYWQIPVSEDLTEDSLETFADNLINECEFFPFHDDSDICFIPEEIQQEYFPNAVTFECVGGGRCFSKNMQFDIVINQELLDLINNMEG